MFVQRHGVDGQWMLDCVLPVTFGANGLMSNASLRQLVVLKSFGQQYAAQGLKVRLEMVSSDRKLFETEAFRNALTDLDLRGVELSHQVDPSAATRITLRGPNGTIAGEWSEAVGPVSLGLALRKVFGEPIYAQMDVSGRE